MSDVLRHWGLLTWPLATPITHAAADQWTGPSMGRGLRVAPADLREFHVVDDRLRRLTSWATKMFSRDDHVVGRIVAAPGAGLTHWMRQVASTSCFDRSACQSMIVSARHPAASCVIERFWNSTDVADDGCHRTLLVDDADTRLHECFVDTRPGGPRRSLIMGVTRRSEMAIRDERTFSLASPSLSWLRTTVAMATQHAGATRPIWTAAAIDRLTRHSQRDFTELEANLRVCLQRGMMSGRRQIDDADVRAFVESVYTVANDSVVSAERLVA